MNLPDVLERLDLAPHLEIFEPAWAESEACFPYPYPGFLDPAEISESRAAARLDAGLEPALFRAAEKIQTHDALCHLAWHCYRLLYLKPDHGLVGKWPDPTAVLKDDAGIFWLLLVLPSAPRMRATHHARGIPAEVTDGMCEDYAIAVSRYGRFHQGKLGAPHTGWFRNHFAGGLVRLGRLQYVTHPFRYAIRVFRHARTGEVLALSEPGVTFTGDGFIDSIPGHGDPAKSFTAALVFDGRHLRGTPILPTGTALPLTVELDTTVWKDAVKRDDPLLAMHIPEGGGMGLDKCRTSMEAAFPFFQRHFAEAPVKGIMCASWMLSPEYESFFSTEANFVRYQRELYLFPTWSSGRDGVYFIFDREGDIDPRTLPRDSSLRKSMAERLEAGGVLRSGGMFFLPTEMSRFGEQPYRRQLWAAALQAGDRRALGASDLRLP